MSRRETNNLRTFLVNMVVTLVLLQVLVPTGISSNRFLNRIQKSFAPVAFAESDGYGACFAVTDQNTLADVCGHTSSGTIPYCMLSGDTVTINSYLYATTGQSVTSATATQNVGTPSPVLTINPGSVSNPALTNVGGGFSRALYQYQVTAPSIANDTLVNLDRVTIFTGSFALSNTVAMHVIGQNHHPALTSLSPSTLNASVGQGGSADLPVSVQYQNSGGSAADLTFELTNDNFQTILQTKVVAGVTAGATATTTFTSLPVGTYTFRVAAKETSLPAACTGSALLDPNINVLLTSATLTSGTVTYSAATPAATLADTGANQQLLTTAAGLTMLIGAAIGFVWHRKRSAIWRSKS